jgi:hypothetical protein
MAARALGQALAWLAFSADVLGQALAWLAFSADAAM